MCSNYVPPHRPSNIHAVGSVPAEMKVKQHGRLNVDDLAQRGIVVAAEVIRAAINRGELPDWFDEELGAEDIADLADLLSPS